MSDGRRTFSVIEKTVRNFDENPTRLIFGGGRPANTPGAGIGPIRQPNNAHDRTPSRAGAAVRSNSIFKQRTVSFSFSREGVSPSD